LQLVTRRKDEGNVATWENGKTI